jgi:pyruvate dehydrogenase E2 component (dihydrolipoamide acetyltransferase)
MSRFEFKLPDIGEGVTEGEIVKWLVAPGAMIREDEPMVEVMTDKATVTITSPKSGKVLELGGKEGSVIAVHSKLVVLDLGNGAPDATHLGAAAAAQTPGPAAKKSEGPAATAVGDIRESLPGMALLAGGGGAAVAPVAARTQPGPPARSSGRDGVEGQSSYYNAKPLATPATRKLARDLKIDLRTVQPSGPNGRVVKDDVQRSARPTSTTATTSTSTSGSETRTPLKGVRKRIFDAMAKSKHTAAHFTFVEECDVGALKALRDRLKPIAAEKGVKLTFLPFFVKAVVAALKKHPALNSAFDEATNEIVERHFYNIGIASATEQGLMVPVVKDADKKSLLAIAADIQRLGEATKSGKIAPDDLRGSTFTITSLGNQGGLFATPILNLPEVGILGLHQMKQKPVVRDGQIVIGDVMLLSLSFDHRLIDGHVGAAFAYEIIAYAENPDRLWLDS